MIQNDVEEEDTLDHNTTMTQPPNDDPRPPDIASSTLGRQTIVEFVQ